MTEKIKGKVTGVSTVTIEINGGNYDVTEKIEPYLNRYKIGDTVEASYDSDAEIITFLQKSSVGSVKTKKGENIKVEPIGSQQKPLSYGVQNSEKNRSMALAYAKDLAVAGFVKEDDKVTDKIIATADKFYKYITEGL